MSFYPAVLALAQRHDLDLNMNEHSDTGLLGDWSEVTCGSDQHTAIERELDEIGVEYDWERVGDRGYWRIDNVPSTVRQSARS